MPQLSQSTLAQAVKMLRSLPSDSADTYPLLRTFWNELLFEWGFPDWVAKKATSSSFNWISIVKDLFNEQIRVTTGSVEHLVPPILQQSVLNKLVAMAYAESKNEGNREELLRRLRLDGFDADQGKFVPIEGPVSATEERTRLLTLLSNSAFARKDVIATHLRDAEELFSQGKMHSAMSEARSAFQAGVEDAVSLAEVKFQRKAGSGFKNQVEFLGVVGFVSADEEKAFLAAWGFLSAGAHPGLPPDEAGRIGLILGLEFMQILLVKATNLL